MIRLRSALRSGLIEATLSDSGTTLTSAALATFPEVIDGETYAALVLDPGETAGRPECVYVTAHTAAATTATIVRGREQATGHSAARAHAVGVRWELNPTPADFGFQAEPFVPVPRSVETAAIVDEDGRLAQRAYVFTPEGTYTQERILSLPPARDHVGERIVVLSGGGQETGGVVEVDPTPTTASFVVSDIFVALASMGVAVDLTTATHGHPFVGKITVDGTDYTSDPVDSVYDFAGDPYGEAGRFLQDALTGPLLASGATQVGGTLSSPTSGLGSECKIADDMEAVNGYTLQDHMADIVLGRNGSVTGALDGWALGEAALYYDPAEWNFDGIEHVPAWSYMAPDWEHGVELWALPGSMTENGRARWSTMHGGGPATSVHNNAATVTIPAGVGPQTVTQEVYVGGTPAFEDADVATPGRIVCVVNMVDPDPTVLAAGVTTFGKMIDGSTMRASFYIAGPIASDVDIAFGAAAILNA